MNSWSNEKQKYSAIPVMKYTLMNDTTKLECLLLEEKSNVNFVHAKSGDSPLILSARYNNIEALTMLLNFGADVEHKNIIGKRALHEAAVGGCVKCVDLLLRNGAKVDVLKRADWTPLMLAATQGHLDVMKSLVSASGNISRCNKDGWCCFHLACREGHVEVLKYILTITSDGWNTVSKNGRTPLHTAAMHGKHEVAKFLVHNANYSPDQKDSCGTTPLMDALRFGFVEIAALLLEHNHNLNAADSLGQSCIHLASQNGQLCSVKYLFEIHNVDINMQTGRSLSTALHLACAEGHLDVVNYLLDTGICVNTTNANGRSALHLAVATNRVAIVQCLLACKNVHRSLPDVNGKIPVEFALNDFMKNLFF